MSNHHLPDRAVVAILLAPLTATLACASRVATAGSPAPREVATAREVATDTISAPSGGKTVENLFAGRFPGVSVTQASGGGLQIRIRGGSNSFYSSNEPLFIVDEVPVPETPGGIVFLNPYDIEKIEVLKNPSDVGVYGIRGGNGVIKITTKRPPAPRER